LFLKPEDIHRQVQLANGADPHSMQEALLKQFLVKARRKRVDFLVTKMGMTACIAYTEREERELAKSLKEHEQRSDESMAFLIELERQLVSEAREALNLIALAYKPK
jgi:hypothetical protein